MSPAVPRTVWLIDVFLIVFLDSTALRHRGGSIRLRLRKRKLVTRIDSLSVLFVFLGWFEEWRGHVRISRDRREKGDKRAGREESVGQVSMGERRGNEKGREDRKGEENIREKMRGETLTSEMLSGRAADMTASVLIDRAISLPSPIACYSLAWHTAQRRALLSLRALF